MARPSRRAGSPVARALSFVIKAGVVGAVVAALMLAVAVAISMASLPSYNELRRSPNGQMVQVKAADGSLLVAVGPSYGEWLRYGQIPDQMVEAMLAVEDRRFWNHPGIDPIGTARAIKVRLDRGSWVQGGSTITQQLARNIFLTHARTFDRKVREAILALALEQRFSKRQILELYLNRVYFGGGAYGIDAASRRFFGHPATRLSLEESAIIAGLVKAPSRYSPTADAEEARRRAGTVLAVMHDAGAISAAEMAAADLESFEFAPQPRQNNVRYFTDWVLAELELLTDETVEPLEVTTTLLPPIQRAASAAIDRHTPRGAQGALVAMSRDGAVRAMVGGRDYVSSIYNRATVARRQPGSAFKLFVYLAALEDGVEPEDVFVDEPISVDGWRPRNSGGGFAGAVTVREAFARSINTVAVQLAAQSGFDTVADMARRFGITTPIDRRPAMALGSSEVTLAELTGAYATVARGGTEARPYGITRVSTTGGRVLYEREPDAARTIVAPWVAARMTELLAAAVEQGTGRAAQIGRPLAGKTGTTSSNKDGWFVGFTGDLVAGVWMGRDDAKPVGGLQGGRAPAAAFAAFMRRATEGQPATPLMRDYALPDDLFGGEPDAEVYGLSEDTIYDPVSERGTDVASVRIDPPAPGTRAPVTIAPAPPVPAPAPAPPRIDEDWLDGVLAEDPTAL